VGADAVAAVDRGRTATGRVVTGRANRRYGIDAISGEDPEALLAERDDLRAQLATKNSEFLAQHRRADQLVLRVRSLEGRLRSEERREQALEVKLSKVRALLADDGKDGSFGASPASAAGTVRPVGTVVAPSAAAARAAAEDLRSQPPRPPLPQRPQRLARAAAAVAPAPAGTQPTVASKRRRAVAAAAAAASPASVVRARPAVQELPPESDEAEEHEQHQELEASLEGLDHEAPAEGATAPATEGGQGPGAGTAASHASPGARPATQLARAARPPHATDEVPGAGGGGGRAAAAAELAAPAEEGASDFKDLESQLKEEDLEINNLELDVQSDDTTSTAGASPAAPAKGVASQTGPAAELEAAFDSESNADSNTAVLSQLVKLQ